MPPRRRGTIREALGREQVMKESAQSVNPITRGHGRGKPSSKARRRDEYIQISEIPRQDERSENQGKAREARTSPPHPQEPAMVEVIATMQGMQRAIENLAGLLVEQGRRRPQQLKPVVATQEQIGVTEQEDRKCGMPVSLSEFMELEPPTFSGASASEDPEQFVDVVERICRALGCSDTRSVELASFQLLDIARIWFDALNQSKVASAPSMGWNEFKEAFMRQFMPESVRDARAREFEKLKQVPGMTVTEYDVQFTQLSRYAPHLIPTERDRIKRFVTGLVHPLFRSVALQMNQFSDYAAVIDCARLIEIRELAEIEVHKKRKRNCGGSFKSGLGYEAEGPRMQAQTSSLQIEAGTSSQVEASSSKRKVSRRNIKPVNQPGPRAAPLVRPQCPTCGKMHTGPCYKRSGPCYFCGQVGHMIRDCPLRQGSSQVTTQAALPPTPMPAQPVRSVLDQANSSGVGMGAGSKGQSQTGRGQPRVFALTKQDA